MSNRTAEIKIRTTPDLKRDTKALYDRWGMSLSEAFNLFMRKSIEVGGLPFDVRPSSFRGMGVGKGIIYPNRETGITVLPDWMDSEDDDGLYDNYA